MKSYFPIKNVFLCLILLVFLFTSMTSCNGSEWGEKKDTLPLSEIHDDESKSYGDSGITNNSQEIFMTTGLKTQVSNPYKDYFDKINFDNPIPRGTGGVAKNPVVIGVPQGTPRWKRYLASAFQGLANRKQGRIFLEWEASDTKWMERWSSSKLYGFKKTTAKIEDIYKLITDDTEGMNVKGLLLYDENIINNKDRWSMLINVYTGICAAEDIIPVPSSQRDNFKNLPVIFDATQGGKKYGKFDSEAEAYKWVIETYPVLRRSGSPTAHQHPSTLREVDYYTFAKILPLYYWSGMPFSLRSYFEKVLKETGSGGLMVGCWDVPSWNKEHSSERGKPGMGSTLNFVATNGDTSCPEHTFLHLSSGYGKTLMVTGEKGVQNLSFQASMPLKYSKPVEQPEMPAYSSSKKYMAFNISDGDNIGYLNETVDGGFGLTTARWWDEASRGIVPISWTIAPGAVDMLPGLVSYLYSTATEFDSFSGASSSWGYILTSAYGKFLPNREKELEKVYKQTGYYMKKANISSLHLIWSYFKDYKSNREKQLADMKIAVKAMKTQTNVSCILGEYGTNDKRNIPLENKIENIDGIPLFNSVNNTENHLIHSQSGDTYLVKLINQIKGLPADKQKFMHIFCVNWFTQPTALVELQDRLGDNYVSVSAAQLGELWKKNK